MFTKSSLIALLIASSSIAFAQQAPAPAAPAAATAPAAPAAPISPEKQKLIDRLLKLWHVEDAAIAMTQRPAIDAIQQARIALQGRVTQAKQEATLKDLSTDVQKYLDEATPVVREKALALKGPVIGPLLAQNFSEEELRQLINILESPVKHKFEQLVPQMERSYGERIAAESRPMVDPKLQAMTQAVGTKLRAAAMTP